MCDEEGVSNTVSISCIEESEVCSVEAITRLASQYGTVWLVRFVPVLRAAVVIMSSCQEAMKCAQHLHATSWMGHLLCVTLGNRYVPWERVQDFSLSAPRRVIQLVSPPPSPPEWWDGWTKHEEGPKSPPTLLLDDDDEDGEEKSVKKTLSSSGSPLAPRPLMVLAPDLYKALEGAAAQVQKWENERKESSDGPPSLTIQAPPEISSGVPQGFVIKKGK